MTVYGFVGPSGTGKSHRALEVAKRMDVPCILDDGLLIRENVMLAGVSAKREASKIASVRRALFTDQNHADEVREALAASGVQSVMILGTSIHMIDRIAGRLDLPHVSKYIDITDVATSLDIEAARFERASEGKHVIPVPTFALKKDFSGYFLSPIRRFVMRGRKTAGATFSGMPGTVLGNAAEASQCAAQGAQRGAAQRTLDYGERTVVRPTFSYLGDYSISRAAIEQLVRCIAVKTDGVVKVTGVDINFSDSGLNIRLYVCVRYGVRIHNTLEEAIGCLRFEIDRQTSLQINEVKITATSLADKTGEYE